MDEWKSEYETLLKYTSKLEKSMVKLERENAKLKASISVFKSINRGNQPINEHSQLIRDICELWDVKVEEIFLPSRRRRVVEARQVAMFALKWLTVLSFAEIGEQLSGLDHSSVSHAIKKVNELAATDRSYMGKLIILNLDKWLTNK